jgi:hypothetical protein
VNIETGDLEMTFLEFLRAESFAIRSYSGRAMFGKNCVGLVVGPDRNITSESDFFATILEQLNSGTYSEDEIYDMTPEIARAIRGMRTDGMGRDDIILYFPRIEWDGGEEVDE